MERYYSDKLSAERLKRCYEIAPARVQQYLNAEVDHVLEKIHPGDTVLELGCGYGRVLPRLAEKARLVIGIDTSLASLQLSGQILKKIPNSFLLQMDAVHLGFRSGIFDVVICVQNGISAFHADQKRLIRQGVRVTRRGGRTLFSSYSEKFWKFRLEWFQLQSEAGLLGEIDYEQTRDGVIVCKDGFTASTVGPDRFLSLASGISAEIRIVEVDESSLFCEITPG